jgi:hypothetical protein
VKGQGVYHKDMRGTLYTVQGVQQKVWEVYRAVSTITWGVYCTGKLAQGSRVIQGGKHKNLEYRVSSTRLW